MTETAVKIVKHLNALPPNRAKAKELLETNTFSEQELAYIAYEVSSECFCEYRDALDPEVTEISLPTIHSNYLYDSLVLLLDHGLNPNAVYNGDNVMWEVIYADAPNLAGRALRLLLERGGNPNLYLPDDSETLFEAIAFCVSYDCYTHEYLNIVQGWLVLQAFGGCYDDGAIPLTMVGSNTVDIFKNFEKYDFYIEPLPQVENYYGCWIMHIFDVETKQEVARYE